MNHSGQFQFIISKILKATLKKKDSNQFKSSILLLKSAMYYCLEKTHFQLEIKRFSCWSNAFYH